jgi:hypothetical protein
MIESLARRVHTAWTNEGVVRDGVSRAELDAFECRYGVRLPPTFRELWLLSDGTGAYDQHLFLHQQLSVMGDPNEGASADMPLTRMLIADFDLQGAYFFLHFEAGEPRGMTTAGYDLKLRPVAESFDAYLELYLANPWSLVGR